MPRLIQLEFNPSSPQLATIYTYNIKQALNLHLRAPISCIFNLNETFTTLVLTKNKIYLIQVDRLATVCRGFS